MLSVMLTVLIACSTSGEALDTSTTPDAWSPEPTLGSTALTTETTWTLDFDEQAEDGGFVDCSYSRTYEGGQIVDQPWLCPDCTVIYSGDAVMTEGYDDCYVQISTASEERPEYWGFTWPDDGSTGLLHRSGGLPNWSLGELGEVEPVALGETLSMLWSSDNELTDGGNMLLSAESSGVVTESDELLVDYDTPREEPYACGWPTDNPGTLSTDYVLAEGSVVPNARLMDRCGEMVDLWDFYGRYLIVDVAQPDCGPCKEMAADAPAGLAAIRTAGHPVVGVTVLGGGLSTPYLEPDESVLVAWEDAYGDDELLLSDRGWGYAIFQPYWGDAFGYPTYALVAPDMSVLAVEKGYGTTTWDDILATIAADAG